MNEHVLLLIRDIAILFPTFLIVFTFRGFFKAFVAQLLGDKTGRAAGFLTLNPVAHVDVYGLLAWIIILYFLGGILFEGYSQGIMLLFLVAMTVRWTYPVPFDERNFKHVKTGIILTILAGPLSNFLLTLIFLYISNYFPFMSVSPNVALGISQLFRGIINVALWFGVLDLLPIPPFDTGYLLDFVVPQSHLYIVHWLEEHSIFIFLALFFLPGVSDVFFGFLHFIRSFIESWLLLLVW